MRLLADGSILSNEEETVVRFLPLGGGSALIVRRYDPPAPCTRWGYNLTLGVSGETFWASCNNVPHEIRIETGAVIRMLPGAPGSVAAVYRGFRAALDRTKPVVSLVRPSTGDVYPVGSTVMASYSCSDSGGSDLTSCSGTVVNGSAIDTATTGPKSFTVTGRDGAGNTTTATVSYTVVPPLVSIADASVNEGGVGGTAARFVVSLSSASPRTVSVRYTTANGSAARGSDYTRTTGTLVFAPGEMSRTVDVPVLGDTLYEHDETFTVALSTASGAAVGDGQATGTIANDDPAPTLSISGASVVEGNSGTRQLVFSVSLSEPSGERSRVNYQTADGTATLAGRDYRAKKGSLAFAAGKTTATISITVLGDLAIEVDETLRVDLSNATDLVLAADHAIGTIANDDTTG
jgi:hypothetical protein